MALGRRNQRGMWRRLYSGQTMLKTIVLLKRNIDQHEGTVTKYTMYRCRRTSINKTSQALQDDMTAKHQCKWMIPRMEMTRLGLTDINVLDRIVEPPDYTLGFNSNVVRYWQPEADTNIDVKLFEDYVFVECLRVDPPNAETLSGQPSPPVPGL